MRKKKTWIAIGTILIIVAVGFGYELDDRLVDLLTSPDSPIWTIIEGILGNMN